MAYFTLKDFLDWEDNCLPEKNKLDADALLDWWRENISALVKELKKEVHLNAFEIEVVCHTSGTEAIRFREAPHGYRADRPEWLNSLFFIIGICFLMIATVGVSAGLAIVIGVL